MNLYNIQNCYQVYIMIIIIIIPFFHTFCFAYLFICLFRKVLGGMENFVDTDQTAQDLHCL